jgi:hypothetical protein
MLVSFQVVLSPQMKGVEEKKQSQAWVAYISIPRYSGGTDKRMTVQIQPWENVQDHV